MPLVHSTRFEDVSLELGDQRLLAHADFAIEPGERVCLIGRNGAGKTSMLGLITGRLEPDHGEIHYQSRIRVSELEQALPEELGQTVREYVTTGLADLQDTHRPLPAAVQGEPGPQGPAGAGGAAPGDRRPRRLARGPAGGDGAERAGPAGGPAAGGAVRRLAAAGGAGARHRRQRRAAAPRRAHQPPRPEHHPVARGPGLQLRRQRPFHHPRPRVS